MELPEQQHQFGVSFFDNISLKPKVYIIYNIVDAVYEVMDKRTYLGMILMATSHILVLLGFILLYKILKPQATEPNVESTDKEQESKLINHH